MSGSDLRHDVAAWVRKAELDRGIALSVDRFLFSDGVCFHCQQCVEKYLKAILVAHDEVPERIHDLVVLATEASDHLPQVEELLDDLTFLSPYSVIIRYPEKDTVPDEAEEAIAAMERVRAALRAILGLGESIDDTGDQAKQCDDQQDDEPTGDRCREAMDR